jgi:hypothetical protein
MLVPVIAIATAAVIALTGGHDREATTARRADPYTRLAWAAHFDRARGPCDFAGAGWDNYGDADAPPCPGAVRVVPRRAAGLPRIGHVRKVARIAVRRADAASNPPRYHAKLYRPFYADGVSEYQAGAHATRPPADVSGAYRTWLFLPRRFTIPAGAWRNVMQFKERYWNGSESGYRSDPSWYLVLTRGRHGIVAGVRHWTDGAVRSFGRDVRFPRRRWVSVTAVVEQGRYIDWYIGRRRIAHASDAQARVGPVHGSLSLAWDFVVGNYAGAGDSGLWTNRISGPLFIAGAEYRTRPR